LEEREGIARSNYLRDPASVAFFPLHSD
jgi:hypothetical protein